MSGFLTGILEWSSRRWLARLSAEVAAGLAVAATTPALVAVVDQHAAAVRDILAMGVESSAAAAGAVLLAAYARGVLAEARTRGWQMPRWSAPHIAEVDWVSLRLLAVCTLAHRVDQAPPALPPMAMPS